MIRATILLALVAFAAATSIYHSPRELEGVVYCDMAGEVHSVKTSTGCLRTPCDVVIGETIWVEAHFTPTKTSKFMRLVVTAKAGIITIPLIDEDIETNAVGGQPSIIRYEMKVPNLFAGLRATLRIVARAGDATVEVCAEADVTIRDK